VQKICFGPWDEVERGISVSGPDPPCGVAASRLGGPALAVLCDTISHVLGLLAVGVVTALLGDRFLLLRLVRQKRTAALGKSG